jgi:hypothetical protein
MFVVPNENVVKGSLKLYVADDLLDLSSSIFKQNDLVSTSIKVKNIFIGNKLKER